MGNFIQVKNTIYSSTYRIRNELPKLFKKREMLSLDVECRSVYDKTDRAEAKMYLKDAHPSDTYYKQARVVSESSGLSYPSITKTTHFIFGVSKNEVYTFICSTPKIEMFIWKQIVAYLGTFLIHNVGFDLKICFERTGKLPKKFIDTMMLAKCLINHVNIWKSKTGLKDLVADYYPPSWAIHTDYEPKDLKDPDFLKYCGFDGSAVWTAYELMQGELDDEKYDTD